MYFHRLEIPYQESKALLILFSLDIHSLREASVDKENLPSECWARLCYLLIEDVLIIYVSAIWKAEKECHLP